jgi:phosphatidylserine/phosphatidylglycerophosphate/cardiolipin synthase-like enzyme
MTSFALVSRLYDERTFYEAFAKDLEKCQSEVYIESPFIALERAATFLPIFKNLLARGVKIYIMTREPKEHELDMER